MRFAKLRETKFSIGNLVSRGITMDQILLKTIEDIGFTNKEASVYLALLELSQGTATQISKITDLKRPIIYVILERLVKDGYVSELPNKKINEYQALDPSMILRQKKSSIKNFADILPLLQTLHHKGKQKPKIHYLENKEAMAKIYNESFYVDEGFFISSYSRIIEHFSDIFEYWFKVHKKGSTKLKGKHLIPNNFQEIEFGKKLLKTDQEVRVFSQIEKSEMDFAIYKNKLAITSFEDEPFMVVIESQSLVDSLKPIFEIAWNSGKEI